jgi:tRNA pseudouridine13 synthase
MPEDFVVEEVLTVKHTKNDCCVCTLEKVNWDTIGVIKVLARTLGISQKRVGYAGLKDRKAVTRQKISVYNIDKEQLEKVKMPRVRIFDIEKGDSIQLGDHTGNRFDILVRDVMMPATYKERIEKGFPNYFGQQRFGDVRPITHKVGKALLKNDLKRAALIFLAQPFQKEKYYSVRKHLWDTHDFERARKEYPLSLHYERAMLENICSGYKEAFKALPQRLNMLFIHAYQAHLFNMIVKKRCEHVPASAVEPGDIISNWFNGKKVLTVAGLHNMDKITEKGLCAAAPIVGYKTVMRGRMKSITEAVLKQEGITQKDFRIKEFPHLSSRGTYREILGKTSDFSYRYTEEGINLKFFFIQRPICYCFS